MATPEEQREYQRRWLANRRANFFADKSCVQCGSTDSLELDHIDRTTKVSHAIWSWSQERRDAETAKCQVLCASCHQEKSSRECRELFSYAERQSCDKGHPLAHVGVYHATAGGGGGCRYCHHLKDAARRGHRVKPIEEFIEYQKRKRNK